MIHIHPSAIAVEEAMVLFDNVMAKGELTWSSQTDDGYAANALGPQTNDFWTPTTLPAELTVILGAATTCDCAAIIGHTLGSAGATIHIEYYNRAVWTTAMTLTPADNRDLMMIFEGAAGLRWRVRITGTTVPHIGVAMIGARLLIPGGARQGYVPLHMALDIELAPSITVTGQYVGTFVKKTGASTSIPLALQTIHWLDTEAVDFIKHYNNGQPFIWAANPERMPRDMAYCWRSGNTLRAVYSAGLLYAEITLEVNAYVGT